MNQQILLRAKESRTFHDRFVDVDRVLVHRGQIDRHLTEFDNAGTSDFENGFPGQNARNIADGTANTWLEIFPGEMPKNFPAIRINHDRIKVVRPVWLSQFSPAKVKLWYSRDGAEWSYVEVMQIDHDMQLTYPGAAGWYRIQAIEPRMQMAGQATYQLPAILTHVKFFGILGDASTTRYWANGEVDVSESKNAETFGRVVVQNLTDRDLIIELQ